MSLLMFFIYSLLIGELNEFTKNLNGIYENVYFRNRNQYLSDLGQLVDTYYNEFGTYPNSLNEMASNLNYIQVKFLSEKLPRLIYSKANIVGDLRYEKVLIAEQNVADVVSESAFLAATSNSCGSTAFTANADFCPKANSRWLVLNNKNKILSVKNIEIRNLDSTLNKILYFSNGFYQSNLADGGATTLANAVGFSGTSNTCQGVFLFGDVILNCHELFNSQGIAITYNYISESHIALLSELKHLNSNGTPIYVARDILK